MKSVILRFRDLVTEEGGTILDHKELIRRHGEVWWGWWMKQYEVAPIPLFKEIAEAINEDDFFDAFLFNSGTMKFYQIRIIKIIAAPMKTKIGTPDFERSPSYYHRGSYPAWFLLSEINETSIDERKMRLIDFPTKLDGSSSEHSKEKYSFMMDTEITSLQSLRDTDVTMWLIEL